MSNIPLQGATAEEDWVPHYTDDTSPIEVSEAYQIYKRFGILVGATHPVTGDDYLTEWINNYSNRTSYENIKARVAGLQSVVDEHNLRQIRTQHRLLIDLRRQYTELTGRLADVMQARTAAEAERENVQRFLTDEGHVREISPYDDTSPIDTVMEFWAGREHPVRLTTKAAQQWYKRFSFALQRGCRDVRNYGPFIGGTPFYRPSLRKKFIFDGNEYGQSPRGIPMTIVDEEMLSTRRINDISVGSNEWEAFGVPLPMDDWNKEINGKQVNKYGYISGKATYDENNINIGGSHVATYGEFLELFGLGPENKIVGGWPQPSDTPEFTIERKGPRGTGGGWVKRAIVVGLLAPTFPLMGAGFALLAANHFRRKFFNKKDRKKIEEKPWDQLFREGGAPLTRFTMIDEYGNIVCPNTLNLGDTNEPYIQSGWSLQSAGQLVYLYPDWDNAIAYDPNKAARGDDPWMPHAHSYRPAGQYEMRHLGGRSGNRNGPYGDDANPDEWRVGAAHDDMNKKDQAREQLARVRQSRNKENDRLDSEGREVRGGGYTYFVHGPRLAAGDHNPNLTIHEKRALVIERGSTKNRFMPLGQENPMEDGPWKGPESGNPNYASYQNPKWPYGTGWYHKLNSDWGRRIYGSRAAPISGPRDAKVAAQEMMVAGFAGGGIAVGVVSVLEPENIWGTNYGMYIGDLLLRLPHRGQFTIINDDDNSPTTVDFDGTIRDGKEINVGFVDMVCRELIHLGVKNRRIGSRRNRNKELKIYTIASHNWKDRLQTLYGDSPAGRFRVSDTTYGDLFKPDADEDDGTGATLDFADFSQKIIKSVAEIPIRREVVDNLLNKTNENMSLMQFLQNIMHPSALGVSTGNISTSIRPSGGDGGFEVIQVSKNWPVVGKKVRGEIKKAEESGNVIDARYPPNVMLFDYKAEDSLIKSMDISAKFDPGIAGTFERAAVSLASGTKTDLMKFLSYGNMALELRDFLNEAGPEDKPELYKDVIRVDKGDAGSVHVDWSRMGKSANAVTDAEKIAVPDSIFTKFLLQQPERMTKLMTIMQTGKDETWATDLLANYMRGCTLTMHGTCNLKPMDYIKITGVLPNMKGLYLIHSVRDSVTPQSFDTIIEAVLIDPDPSDENKDAEETTG